MKTIKWLEYLLIGFDFQRISRHTEGSESHFLQRVVPLRLVLEELVNSVCLVICNFVCKPSAEVAGTNVVSARLVQLQWLPLRPWKSFDAPILSD